MPPLLRLLLSAVVGLGFFVAPVRVDGRWTVAFDVVVGWLRAAAPEVVSGYALFVVAAAMSKQPGAVTLEAFKQLPPIQSLRGELPDDLSDAEIADAWAAVSTPSTRRLRPH